MQEETVADENVDNFKSNQVRIDFAIRANWYQLPNFYLIYAILSKYQK
jgi:hypothetical protein